ncbi:MAG: TonB-dependent receptor [Idiomarina sp.]|nr:TonB-dependent receptor [Idiomarina sp.]
MYTNSKLAKSVRLALMYGATATLFAGTSAAVAQDQDEDAVDRTERIQVTGSRIQRTDMEQSVPITVIDRDAIDLSGEISVTDVIRGTTFNSAGSFRPQSGNAAQGTATVNMRGLGSDRTLVLLDGRRLPKAPATGGGQDLNVVPLAAVERIEILSDGASAVYGSDAIGGVINIVTRTDFTGVEVRLGGAEVSIPREGGDREEGSIVFGTTSDTTRVIGGVSWNKRDIIFENAYDWVTPGFSIYGNNFTEMDTSGGFRSVTGDACGNTENFYLGDSSDPLSTCGYDFNATNANEASTSNEGLFVKVDHEINRDWTIFANASYSKASSFGRYAPALNDPGSPLRSDSVNNPTNPDSPYFNQSVFDGNDNFSGNRDVLYFHRFASIGDRDSYVDATATDLLVGAEGRWGNFDIDFGVRRSRSNSKDLGYNYLLRSGADSLVNITAAEVADGIADQGDDFIYYDLGDPLGARYTTEEQQAAYQAMINSMNVTIARDSDFNQDEVFGSVGFDVAEVGAGMIQAVVGFEYREENYRDQYDSLSEAGVVGGSAGNSAGGGREVTSAYTEVLVPVTYDLEFSFAARFDDYSDYGTDFSPKASFRYEPMQGLVMRGSYGQGFRAPTLPQITMAPSSGNPSVTDPATCLNFGQDADCDVQVRQTTLANPDLESEQSDQWSLGVAYQPVDWLSFAVDYWNIEITDRIAFFGAVEMLRREEAGEPIPAGLGIDRNMGVDFSGQVPAGSPVNPILGVTGGYGNDGTYDTDGLDVNVRTNFDFGEWGRLTQNLQVAYTFNRSIDGGRNSIRNPGEPRHRTTLNNVYTYGDFDFGWNVNVIGNQYDDVTVADGVRTRDGNIATWTTHDLQLSYNTAWDGRITVGMLNAFEKAPQLRAFGGRSYNFNLYDAFGRVSYIRYTQRF